jgi:hypothetical protein
MEMDQLLSAGLLGAGQDRQERGEQSTMRCTLVGGAHLLRLDIASGFDRAGKLANTAGNMGKIRLRRSSKRLG